MPYLWLLSDARNDTVLETALASLPRGSGFVYRHYHLPPDERRARLGQLTDLARSQDHRVILSTDDWRQAEAWGCDGVYGNRANPSFRPPDLLWLATAHDAAEVAAVNQGGADGVFLSPVFPTRSHPGGASLGIARFHELAALSAAPVIALGGVNAARALELDWPRWGAIDGLSPDAPRPAG